MIPLFHDFGDETVLVFGGGSVGARKARRFDLEARVVVVSPAFGDHDFGDAERVEARPSPDEVGEWFERHAPTLAVAATDDASVNEAVEATALERGVLVNRADRAGGDRPTGSVVVPATVRDDPVSVAISTGGSSPALARHLRETVAADVDGAGAMAELTASVREQLREDGVPETDRREAVRAVVRAPAVWKALRTGDVNARSEAARVLRETLTDR